MFHADLHVHSKFSRACSKDCDIEHLSWWALRKGVTVLGTGDFTHPAWAAELRETLVPAEPGLFRIRPELEKRLIRDSPASCAGPIRFMLSVEISSIYRRAERTRKVHNLIYAPSFDAADRITADLAKIGNLASDGRPILGLDSRDLLEITLSADPGCFLVPAHVWTPWFAVLGSRSGFDTVQECYADLAGHVFAVETGLSSDPAMNWTCSALDAYRLVSNSDAHSPPMLGREATAFDTDLDYFAMVAALRTGNGLAGTVEFFPEEGKYHLDGHRKCGVRVDPEQAGDTRDNCPECGKPLTIGVLHRVAELADRPPGFRPAGSAGFTSLVQLPEIMGEILATGPKSKKVVGEVGRLVAALGPELSILRETPLDDVQRAGGSPLREAIARLRRGEVIRDAGYDGEYGTIRLFQPGELGGEALFGMAGLFEPPTTQSPEKPKPAERARVPRTANRSEPRREGAPLLDELDPEQRAAAAAAGPLLIVAGPGSGKTRTLTHRIAHQILAGGVPAGQFLAITFTRRAADEMRQRLAALCPEQACEITVTTFHGLGLRILREHPDLAGLSGQFGVADEAARLEVATEVTGSERAARKLLAGLADDPEGKLALRKELAARDLVDFDGLVEIAAALLDGDPAIGAGLHTRWPHVSVDEYQDIDPEQYRLLRGISGDGAGLTAIGDPDQAIYGFRGADVGIFGRFATDFPAAAGAVELTRNYRSSPAIVAAATQAIAPTTLVPGRKADAVRDSDPLDAVTFHEAADEHAEAAWIAAAIDQLLGGTSFHSLDSGRADGHDHGRLALADIAVLYRTDAQAGPLGQALTRAGLPFQKSGHDLLSRRTAVAEVMREMLLVGGSASDVDGSASDVDGSASDDVSVRLKAAVRALAAARGERDATVVDIRAAGELLMPLARRCETDIERFRTEVALGAETDALDPRADAITLLTLHGAKGLEFDTVFLAGCESGLLPLRFPGSGRSTDGEAAVSEERRLLFVGMTRARSRLLLSCAARRTRHGFEAPAGRSPFLAAIDQGLLSRSAPERAVKSGARARQLRLL
jgi:DNA helicase II / ATP-dependent DNA helicase PcrA